MRSAGEALRGRRQAWLVILALSILSTGPALAQNGSKGSGRMSDGGSPFFRANHYYEQYRYRQALPLYLEVIETEPDHFWALCRAGYLYGKLGKLFKEKNKQKKYYDKLMELARRAYFIDPDHAESNFVMAWAFGGVALVSGARDRVKAAREIKRFLDVALEKDPRHDRAWYLLANWNFKVANASFFERTAARMLFGGLPKGVTNGDAVDAYRKAIGLRPDSLLYRYELAMALEKAREYGDAVQVLERLLKLEAKTEEDPRLVLKSRQKVQKLRKKLS